MCSVRQTYVCVEEKELIRLKYNEARLHSMKSAPKEQINHIRDDIENQLKEKLAKIEHRQLEYQQYVNDLNGTMRYLEIESQRKFSEQNHKLASLREEYFSLLRMERDEYLSIFESQDIKFTRLIAEAKKEREKTEVSRQNNINSLLNDHRKQEKVKNFTEELAILIKETIKIPHQQFAPGKFDKIKSQLQTASEDINNGFFETALSTSRNAYWQLIELRATVLQKEHELITLYSAIMEVLSYLILKASLNRTRKLDFGSGNSKKEIEIDIDYWTQGQFSKYESEIKSFQRQIIKNEANMSGELLKELIKQIELVELKFNDIMDSARENILSSQLRANIAQKTVRALKEQLFTVDNSVYENNDPRNAYYVKLKNRAGNEIVIIIKQLPGEFGKNEILIHFYDNKLINQNAFQDRAVEITRALSKQGLEVEKLKTVNSLDIENLSKDKMSFFDEMGKP